ncbi:MAG: hypothetical protein SGILL_009951, partial [Bacillariaceae sp.]
MFQEGIFLSNHGASMMFQGAKLSQAGAALGTSIRKIQQSLSELRDLPQPMPLQRTDKSGRAVGLEAFSLPATPRCSSNRRFVYSKVLKIVLDPQCSELNGTDVDDLSMVCSGAAMFNLALCNHLQGLNGSFAASRSHNKLPERLTVNKLNMAARLYGLVLRLLQDRVRELSCRQKHFTFDIASLDTTFLSLYLIARNNLSAIMEMSSRVNGEELRRADSQAIQIMNLIESTAYNFPLTNLLLSEEDWQGLTGNCL